MKRRAVAAEDEDDEDIVAVGANEEEEGDEAEAEEQEQEDNDAEGKPSSIEMIPQHQHQQQQQMIKRRRTEDNDGALIHAGVKRTSDLQAPIMMLTGHEAAIYTCKFSPNGLYLASGSFDRNIFLWNVYDECTNFHVLKGHGGAVLDLLWSRDGNNVLSVATDKSVVLWDAMLGTRIRKYRGHTSIVNSCSNTRRGDPLFCTGSDDGSVRLWDSRTRGAVAVLKYKYQVTAVSFNEGGDQIFSGSLDNKIAAWDLRKKAVVYELKGHHDTITSLRLSPDGSTLLSNAMDNTVRTWDVKPFAAANRLVGIYEGAPHGIDKNLIKCCWSADGTKIAAGSGDRTANIWDVSSGRLLYKLTGHKGCVNEVDLHPKESILLSGGSDKVLFLGELDFKY